ncbi:ABC transporter substrate-binding protein [Tersicoccus sp. Bi-70]|uniref:ABC transporter substrate-binding protein n=1 Tax=Tersicoccus sp. Bi-70 TaxID=1897634 RepID=UPI000975BA97|nr:ABC transporter substrate-binding protein [Tersicoccus sp. Bi-70]OMH34872.1 ABC transporter substrate-binding protein [Tersicoccus sp. Bi-70]
MRSRLLASALVLTVLGAVSGCSNSDTTSSPATNASGSSVASFDPTSVAKDDALAGQVPDAIKSKGTLTVGSDTSYAPAEFLKEDGQTAQGYDIDLAKAIAATLGLKATVQTAEFGSILPALGSKYDVGMSSFTINAERLKAVNMVSYFKAGTQWAVKKGNPKNVSVDDVCGKTVGVQTGTVQESPDLSDRSAKCKAAGKDAITIVSLKNQTDVTTRLVNGSIDAMAADSPITSYAITQTNGQIEKVGDVYDAAPQAITVAKKDTALAGLMQKTMQKLIDDGTYTKILASWNNTDGAVKTSELNPAQS